jgi:hypothetical protein
MAHAMYYSNYDMINILLTLNISYLLKYATLQYGAFDLLYPDRGLTTAKLVKVFLGAVVLESISFILPKA